MSSLWINLCSTDKVFSQFCERGREHWEAVVIKLGTQMQIGASWLGALNWGTLWTQKNVQGPLTHPAANAGSLVRCLQLIGMSETPKGEVLLIFFTKVRRKFPLDCNLQMPTLYPQTLFLPVLGSAESVQPHVTSQLPKAWGEDKKLSCRWLVPYSCLQSAFTAAEMMCKRKQ